MQNPESIRVMKQDRTTKSTLPVTFPESYPFSLLSVVGNPDGMTDGYTDHTSKTVIPALGETAAAILVLGLCSSNKHFFNFLDISLDIEGKDRFVALLTQFFRVSMSVLDNEAYPKTWLNINILAHKVLVKMMEPITTILEKAFIPEPDSVSQFDTALWNDAFTVLLKILSSDQLVIEEFSPQVSSPFPIVHTLLMLDHRNAALSGAWREISGDKVPPSCYSYGKRSGQLNIPLWTVRFLFGME